MITERSKDSIIDSSDKRNNYTSIYDCINVYSSDMFFNMAKSTDYVKAKNGDVYYKKNIGGNFKILKHQDKKTEVILIEWHPKPFFFHNKYINKRCVSSSSSFASSDVSLENIPRNHNGIGLNGSLESENDIYSSINPTKGCGMSLDNCKINNRNRCNAMQKEKIYQSLSSDLNKNMKLLSLKEEIIHRNNRAVIKHCPSLNNLLYTKKKNNLDDLSRAASSYLSNRNTHSIKDIDSSNTGTQRSSSFFFRKKSIKASPYVDGKCDAYYPIYREYNDFITTLKIYISERNNDCGHLVIYNIEGISKSFNFLRGGIKKLISLLNTFKWLRIYSCVKQYRNHTRKQVFYKNISFPNIEDSLYYNSKFLENFFINKPIDLDIFSTFFNEKGQLVDVYNFKRFGYLFGFDEVVRPEAWKFIFGYYLFSSTFEERSNTKQILADEYLLLSNLRYKDEHLSNKRNNFLSIIEKDVIRTDRKNPFYSGDDNPNLEKMKNILLNYSYYRPNIGYSQGMSDLLAPILSLLQDESDSFWCFVGFMETLLSATLPSEDRMDHMMFLVLKLMEQLCPDIIKFLRRNELEISMIFLHRWFILSFQREFSVDDGFRIWEACWFCPILDNGYFQIFVAVAIMLKYHKRTKCKRSIFFHTSDEILTFFTNIIKHSNAQDVLNKARKLVSKIRLMPVLPCELRVFLFVPLGWNPSYLTKIKCNCLNEKNCIYKVWTLNNKMKKLITDSIDSFQKQHPRVSSQIRRITKSSFS